tara:strand:- start:4901 stop:5383 length:483 start_codon:yes stop_codon:yes gene_type:complete
METTAKTAVDEGTYENPWIYQDSTFSSIDIGDFFGFVYCISNNKNGRKYIGRKYFWQKRKPRGGGRRVTSESNWKAYYGSCPELKEDIRKYGRESFSRAILSLHRTGGRVNYSETRELFRRDVLTASLTDGTPAYYNSNILGRYYRKDYYGTEPDQGLGN